MIRYILIATLSLIFIVTGYPAWLLSDNVPNLCKSCSYSLFHANIFHLAVNCLSIWFLFMKTPIRSDRKNLQDLVIGYLIATATFFTATRPVVGISNVLFAVIGLRTPHLGHPWWKSPGALTFFSITLLMLVFPQFSALTHITSFIAGSVVAMVTRTYRSLERDYGHATGR